MDYNKMDIEKEIGIILTKFKHIEYLLNCIIGNFVSAKEYGFFDNVVLNSQVISTGNKLKIIKTICKIKKNDYNFEKLHQLLNLRNLFAHENYYMEHSKEGYLITIDLFRSNGEYDIVKIDDKLKEFNILYEMVLRDVTTLNEELSNS